MIKNDFSRSDAASLATGVPVYLVEEGLQNEEARAH